MFQFQVELGKVCSEELLCLRLQSCLVEADSLGRYSRGEMEEREL